MWSYISGQEVFLIKQLWLILGCPIEGSSIISEQLSVKVKGLGWVRFFGGIWTLTPFSNIHQSLRKRRSAIFVCGDKNVYLFRNLIMRYNSLPPCVLFHFALRVNSVRVFLQVIQITKICSPQTRQNVAKVSFVILTKFEQKKNVCHSNPSDLIKLNYRVTQIKVSLFKWLLF